MTDPFHTNGLADRHTPLPLPRRHTRQVRIGSVPIGGSAPIVVQSMTKTDTHDVAATVAQVRDACAAGCDIMRVAVPDAEAAESLRGIVQESPCPIVADIHFDYRLALTAIDAGAHKVRINPGNIGAEDRVRAIVDRAGEAGIPIRVGVNAGSLERDLLAQYGHATSAALAESAARHVQRLEGWGFRDIVVSIKASDVWRTVEACRRFAELSDCPQHVGVTEAGLPLTGATKSAAALGILFAHGIGDTLRVSLTGPPVTEVQVACTLLSSLGLRQRGVTLISCPTCGRTQVPVCELAERVAEYVRTIDTPITVAVMGCVVNGPGEAKEADVGICGGKDSGGVFRHGEVVRRVPADRLFEALVEEIESLVRERNAER